MTPFVVPLDHPDATDLAVTGGKGANLARLVAADFAVPPGFCVTTAAFEAVVEAAGLESRIEALEALDPADVDAVAEASAPLRAAIAEQPLPTAAVAAVEDALSWLDGAGFAVRSSATAEDLPGASFAGQHETFLGVAAADVPDRVRDCLASLFTDRAVTYRLRNHIPHAAVAMAVVVQVMVEPAVAGVLFTADPVTGSRRVASVDAAYGLGDTVVAGDVSPDNARVDRDTGTVLAYEVGEKATALRSVAGGGTASVEVDPDLRETRALTENQLRELVAVGDRIEALLGPPQDVEWALVDGAFVVLQSRPITSLFPVPTPPPVDGRPHVYLSFGHAQAMAEAMPPLVLDFWRGFLDGGAALLRGDATEPWAVEAGGRVYLDLTPLLGVGRLREVVPGRVAAVNEPAAAGLRALLDRRPDAFPHRGRLADARTVGRAARNGGPAVGWAVARLVGRVGRSFVVGPPSPERELARVTAWGDGLADRVREPATLTGRAEAVFDRVDLSAVLTGPLPRVGGALLAGVLAGRVLRLWFPAADADLDALGKGFEHELVTRMNQRLGDLADRAREDPEVLAALQPGTGLAAIEAVDGGGAFVADVEAFLDDFGHRASGEIDLSRPRWRDQPGTLLGTVRSSLERGTPGAHREHLRRLERAAAEAADRLASRAGQGPLGPVKRRLVRRLIRTYRGGIQLREYPKHGAAVFLAAAHDTLAEAGRALAEAGRLGRPDDVWFLRRDELLDALDGDGPIEVDLEARRRDHERYARMTPPPVLTSEGETPAAAPEDRTNGVLRGTPVSSGVVEGRARVVRDPTSESLAPGEILVAPSTDPGWTPLFLNAAGLVMEVGGRMTHGALVAREYGLPAVAAVEGATTAIRTGDRLRVDGTHGTVERLEGG